MPLDFQRARPLLQNGNLTQLFVEELGWEHCRQKLTLRAGETDYAFIAVAEKRGFTAWLCASADGRLPDHSTRLKLDRALTQTSFEHLIVFATTGFAQQSWMWVRREPGRPLSARTHEFNRAQPGDSLLQKLQILYVSLEEEEKGELSTITIAGRARAAFDIERVTKAFYRDFDTHRKAFLMFIDGIGEVADREWYASVMLNRLMFVYFIQRKGFLDANPHYLRNRLQRCQQEKGKDKFYTFYRYFLLRLFHEGFGKRRKDRAPDLEKLLGNIPYLNGGLFDVHELEKPERYGKAIQIPDKAFERVFDYFDQYQWHLDERPLRADNEINPDVLGYIFEKYINQKQMGAYYTKEDITEYISKNTVLPFLFDAARAKCKVAFEQGGTGVSPVWDLLKENPDRYIYPAVRHGAERPLPPEIAAGLDTIQPDLIERRKAWNKPAPAEYALPTEIWREVVARRQRYWQVWSRLTGREPNPQWVANPPGSSADFQSAVSPISNRQDEDISGAPGHPQAPQAGSTAIQQIGNLRYGTGVHPSLPISDINDFITLNLDIRQFAQDVIVNCEGPDLLMAFWQAITAITVLDPTGGSGAFIFAALNILEPLYEACLDRMEAFLAEWGENGRKAHPNYHKKFTEVLARVDAHPNRRYFVLKSIILNNLYAVDIMEEAVEICKLRLFLKLAAQVEPNAARDNLGIEPLPDIDFNIRAGNTLVGYATAEEVRRCMKELGGGQMKLMDEDELGSFARFNTRCADVEQSFSKFRQLQTEGDGSVPTADKLELQKRLKALEDELNRHLAGEYGVKVSDKAAYAKWVKSHQPFHWFIQFYGILNGGGFDVIIGNPPYVEYAEVSKDYTLRSAEMAELGNLHAMATLRSLSLLTEAGCMSMIVPVALPSTERFSGLRAHLVNRRSVWTSHYDFRPAKLFEGAEQRLTIFIIRAADKASAYSTKYNRWYVDQRPTLFPCLAYAQWDGVPRFRNVWPKLAGKVALSLTQKVAAQKVEVASLGGSVPDGRLYYKNTGVLYWTMFTRQAPRCFINGVSQSSSRETVLKLRNERVRNALHCALNSSLFFLFYQVHSNCRDLNPSDIQCFRVPESLLEDPQFTELSGRLHESQQTNSEFRIRNQKLTGEVRIQTFSPAANKAVFDEIDTVLAGHYGFTAEELDFILNYDIKYRLGRDTETEEE